MRKGVEFSGFMRFSAACAAAVLCWAAAAGAQERPKVGVAFGGGSARGLAHVGVIRWLEEHHIPIDVAAGTSIGGLIGGSFATGMPAAELEAMLDSLDWDSLFGSFNFEFKNIRRKADARAYPPRLELGLKRGLSPPTALNNGQQVDRLIDRITAPYYATPSFDSLPTPFRAVAVDLRTARQVVLDRGSLARAIRATVSFPGLFPPVEVDGQVLIDGGAMNNVPADVVRAMGASVVIAVSVGDLRDRTTIDYSMFGIMADTLDAMIRANTKDTLDSADVVLNVPVDGVGSLDWHRSREVVEIGYQAAEAMRAALLPHAIGAADWDRWVARRKAARKTAVPPPKFVSFEGVAGADESRMRQILSRHLGRDLDLPALERDLDLLVGLERYESIWWETSINAAADSGLTIRARPRPYSPPFLMLGFTLENTTSDEFQVSASARYLRFDVAGSGSELRLDGTAGSDPALSVSLYRPMAGLFVTPRASVSNRSVNVIEDDAVVARYGQRIAGIGLDAGVNLGRLSDAWLGLGVDAIDADVLIGDPGLPAVKGRQTVARAGWRYDSQDSPVVPSRGVRAAALLRRTFDAPAAPPTETGVARSSAGLTQFTGEASAFWPVKDRHRLFVLGGVGSSFNGRPLRFDQFSLGSPLHLGAFGVGELFGDHYVTATAGYLREMGHLPSFLGGGIFAGGWLEQGSAFDDRAAAAWHLHVSSGVIVDTVLGPVMLAASAGSGRRWRTYVSIGPIF